MKLTRGEFCQFNPTTRLKLLKEFGKNVLEKQIRMKSISIYRISDFYVEVYENLDKSKLEKVEPVRSSSVLEVYNDL
ncbi:MAG: hypothetical protein ACXWCG_03925 [Flavitalea sp.]